MTATNSKIASLLLKKQAKKSLDYIRGGSRGGVQGVATPPNDSEKPHPTVYKAYYSLWFTADKLCYMTIDLKPTSTPQWLVGVSYL